MPKRSPKLLFTDEERNAPELKRAVKKADKAAANLDKAEAHIPKKQIKKKQRYIDKDGKVKTKIMFEEVDKKRPSSNLKSEIKTAPAHIAGGCSRQCAASRRGRQRVDKHRSRHRENSGYKR
ncbi:MAG: hypothetical protein LUF26_04615 [Firmicutes bacterium]|nr:hypothetical protein [Bacillota bacterium]